ncbi:MAG TPA: HAD family phosphatase [Caulobacteraceae bacterium]|jgi:HAD superfamily hydrolase (TIGR01509 family)|nr:HAD family phosphatase [Caulobacteraceae bacterium]
MVFPREIRAVVFDMDGLLVDTEALIRDLAVKLAPQFGGELPFEVFQQMVGLPNEASEAVSRAHFGPDFPLEAYQAEMTVHVRAALALGVALKSGVIELLDDLDAAGIPRAICTSSSHPAVQRTLGPSGILPRFNAVVAAGDYPRGKPNPDPFLTAAARLGVAPEDCLALEDSHNGVRAAHAAGMMTVMVPDLLAPTDEMREKTHAIVESLHHVRDMIDAAATPGARKRL